MRRWWPILALLLSVGLNLGLLIDLALSSPAVARGQQEALRPAAAGRLQQLADRLGLQGPSRRRFIVRQRQFFAETAAPRARLPEIRRQVRAELVRPNPDQARISVLLREAADIYYGLEQSVVANVLDSRSMLTPEQEKRYTDLISRLALEGPGQMGKLKPAAWPWWWRLHPPAPAAGPLSPLDRDRPGGDAAGTAGAKPRPATDAGDAGAPITAPAPPPRP